jgi:hypothetical protein
MVLIALVGISDTGVTAGVGVVTVLVVVTLALVGRGRSAPVVAVFHWVKVVPSLWG